MTDVPEWLAIPRPEEIHHEPDYEPHVRPDGSCSCDVPHRAIPQQVVYTLHFDPPYEPYPGAPAYKTARHYTGKTLENRLEKRLIEHEEGRGARLTQVQREAGGTWRLASVEPGGADRERQLKQHSAARRCPICQTETAERWRESTSPQPEPRVQPDVSWTPQPESHAQPDPQPEPQIPLEHGAGLEPYMQPEPQIDLEFDAELEPG
jgi:predicted GIY-YIG superfamily endonuclease